MTLDNSIPDGEIQIYYFLGKRLPNTINYMPAQIEPGTHEGTSFRFWK